MMENIFWLINSFALRYFWLDTGAIFFAYYFPYIFVFGILVVFLILALEKPKVSFFLSLTTFLSGILARAEVEIIRFFYYHPRPFVEHPSAHFLISHANTSSFPSGHAAFFFALSTMVYFFNKKLGWLSFFLSFLIALSRVFVGVHWFGDVFWGAVLGIVTSALLKKVISGFLQKPLFQNN